MPWVIVRFIDSEEVEAVPQCWYNGSRKSIFYPNYPKNRMEKAIKNELEPECDWQEYSVSLMRDTIYDNFRSACAKASKCCITSELSELEPLIDKRKPKRNNKFTSSEESGSDLDIPIPQVRKAMNHHEKKSQESHDLAQIKNLNITQKPKETNSEDISTEIANMEMERVLLTSDDIKFRKTCIEMLVKNCRLIKDCNRQLQELLEKFDTFIQLSKKTTPVLSNEECILDLFRDFPIKNDEMLEHVESILKNEEAFKRLVDGLCKIGGKDFKECCRRFLKKIIDDKFASGYSLAGHKQKKIFKTLKICDCVFEAVQFCNRGTTLKEIEIVASAYLAKANDRLKRQQDVPVPTENN